MRREEVLAVAAGWPAGRPATNLSPPSLLLSSLSALLTVIDYVAAAP